MGLIGIYSSLWPQMSQNQVLATPPTGLRYLTATRNAAQQHTGDPVCRVGLKSGRTCGQVTFENETMESQVGAIVYYIDHTYGMDFDSLEGDSGGPVFQYSPTPGNVIGYGTHVHSEDEDDEDPTPDESWYSTINWGWTAYNSLFGVTYSVCTTSPC